METEKRVHERVRCMASPLDVSVHGAHKASNYRVIRPVGTSFCVRYVCTMPSVAGSKDIYYRKWMREIVAELV